MAIRTVPFRYTTLQALLNAMYIPVMRQGVACTDKYGGCAIRSEDGTRACAFGHLLTDGEQAEKAGGGGVGMVGNCGSGAVCLPDIGVSINTDYYSTTAPQALIAQMQGAHDGSISDTPERFRERFLQYATQVANKFGLTVPDWETTEIDPQGHVIPPAVKIGAAVIPPRKAKVGQSKRYAADVYRRAAKILEENPQRHVQGYGRPFAGPDLQCFCAIAAVDMVLKADNAAPPGKEVSNGAYDGDGRSFDRVYPTGIDMLTLGGVIAELREKAGVPGNTIWAYNDHDAFTDYQSKDMPGYLLLKPEGNKAVVKLMREAARALEHGKGAKVSK